MSFCLSPDRKTIFLPGSGFGAFRPLPGGLRPSVSGDRGLGVRHGVGASGRNGDQRGERDSAAEQK